MYERAKAAADYIRERCGEAETAIVLGSGLNGCIALRDEKTVKYSDIPDFPVTATDGHKNEWASGFIGDKKVFVLRGRFHHYEGFSYEDIVLPQRVMKLLGVKTVIMTNAAGAINPRFLPGELMLVTDHINWGLANPLVGKNEPRFGVRFPDMSDAYDKKLRDTVHSCAEELGIPLHDGVYICFEGPSFETPAEIRAAEILGADAVGMSTVPEVVAAVHCGIKVITLSLISNMAAGISDVPLSIEDINIACAPAIKNVSELIKKTVQML